MTHASLRRRTAGRLGTAVVGAALVAASVTGHAAAQSTAGSSGVPTGSDSTPEGHDATATHATTTHGNLTVTHEIVGPNLAALGETVHYRTTVSAAEGPARTVTRIAEEVDKLVCGTWNRPTSATVTYTDEAGHRVTDSVPGDRLVDQYGATTATGAWTVDAATAATVVFESSREFVDTRTLRFPSFSPIPGPGPGLTCGEPGNTASLNLPAALDIGVDGLGPLRWSPTGVTASCADECRSLRTAVYQAVVFPDSGS